MKLPQEFINKLWGRMNKLILILLLLIGVIYGINKFSNYLTTENDKILIEINTTFWGNELPRMFNKDVKDEIGFLPKLNYGIFSFLDLNASTDFYERHRRSKNNQKRTLGYENFCTSAQPRYCYEPDPEIGIVNITAYMQYRIRKFIMGGGVGLNHNNELSYPYRMGGNYVLNIYLAMIYEYEVAEYSERFLGLTIASGDAIAIYYGAFAEYPHFRNTKPIFSATFLVGF